MKFLLSEKRPAIIFLLLLAGIANIYRHFFPNTNGLLGHDFSHAHPALLDGVAWFWSNNLLDVPWFTPSFCGGQPFFSDPQSFYYSPLQIIALLVPPTSASFLTMLLSCSLGYASFYVLMRKVFLFSINASIIAGTLAMMNTFIPDRFIVGEMGYQLFPLTGFVAYALLSKSAWNPVCRAHASNIVWAGISIALMLQGGLTTLMLPAAFGVLALAIVARLTQRGANMRVFFYRSFLATLLAFCLCASKIAASTSFMGNFPRDMYALPGFSNIFHAIFFPLLSLFFSSMSVSALASTHLKNAQWAVFPHEWAYQFGVVFLALLLAAAVVELSLKKNRPVSIPLSLPIWKKLILWLALIIILALPAALLWYEPGWNTFLKHIPLIKSTSFPFRWIIIFIPVCCWAGARAWHSIEQHIQDKKVQVLSLLIFGICTILEAGSRDFSYYTTPSIQFYDPHWIDEAWKMARTGNLAPITQLTNDDSEPAYQGRNDSIVLGKSFIECYNPAYGYRLETLPVGRLRTDESIYSARDEHLNIKNPACLVWPTENHCMVIGDEYLSTAIDEVKKFSARHPVNFEISFRQKYANLVTISSIIFCGIYFVLSLVLAAAAVSSRCKNNTKNS
ncbi:MAG TPA: hypothetical protein PLF22_00215 [Pseudomonadales bacterium]|nr:hypothetical protein [Pseudomonadales bacterium]